MYKTLFLFLSLLLSPQALAADLQLTADVIQRRQAMMEKMHDRGMLILFSADPAHYSGDVDYEFRQENNLYYLTGIRQPNTTLVLMPQNFSRREILFLSARNPARELWTGELLTTEEAREISGIETVWNASDFDRFIDSILYGRSYHSSDSSEYRNFFIDLQKGEADIFFLLESKPGLKGKITKEFQFANRLRERFTGVRMKDAAPFFHQLRMIKSPYEIRQLQKAIDITVEALNEAIKIIHPEIWEYQVEAIIEYVFKRNNSFDWAFPSIVASGPNATTLHYQKSERQTQREELLLMDVGAEFNYYAADITRTVPVGGRFTSSQGTLYQLVLDAQKAGMEAVRPGASFRAINRAAVEVLKKGLHRLGLITSTTSDQYRVFFPHGVGHFLGLDVHDVRHEELLKPNMVLTVEPGIYVRSDSMDRLASQGVDSNDLELIRPAVAKFMNIGIRIEDDVRVTETGYELLSGDAPREILDIEASVMPKR
ncbi:MAG: aminopeptidase P family protein [Acidobacteriota bacterium]